MDPDRPPHEMTLGFGLGGAPEGRGAGRARGPATAARGVVLRAFAVPAAAGLLLGLAISLGWSTPAVAAVGDFLDFYCGVFALVALSISVMIGVLAAEQTLLSPGNRVRAQALHRAAAFTAVAMLLLHLATQLLRHRVGAAQMFLPTRESGLGTVAFYLLIVAVASGIARGRFAASRRPWTWRALHLTAYAAWPLAIGHGLTAGRDPAPWVTAAYLCCLGGVAAALAARPILRARAARRAP
ncbi:hypothetical protein [Actinomadura rugatobispora]|uniref:Ferric oxidoreductase domain-containing protein n=1 Tax=Actinomadura rugatobispora TaxID=1994 RepID=A0ABW1AB85_9ACTN|nr:hypothetical protein GCM10010200_084610 [Actinomadura rugatobispora]